LASHRLARGARQRFLSERISEVGEPATRLRPGTWRRIDRGHEIVLQDAQMGFSSSTVAALPLAVISKSPLAVEIMSDVMSNPSVEYCFHF
jgi:hypothetical protein